MLQSVTREFLDFISAGGWVMPPLVFLMLLLWFAIGYRISVLQRGSKRGARNLIRLTEKKPHKYADTDGVLIRAVTRGLDLRKRRLGDLRRFLDDAFAEEEHELHKFHVLITTIVMVAPLLGLLGTVVGMIETFDSLGEMSLYSQSGGIAGGISQALFSTQMGLAVAIPGLIVNGVLGRRQKDIELELAQIKDILCAGESTDSDR